jgi:hypothetical protein
VAFIVTNLRRSNVSWKHLAVQTRLTFALGGG